MRARHAWWIALAAVLLAGCEKGPEEKVKDATKALQAPAAMKRTAAANDFGFRLFTGVQAADPKTNLLVSPTGAAMVLDMVYGGAAGQTKTEMATVLGLGDTTPQELARANRSLLDLLPNADPKVEIRIANALWVNKGIKLNEVFGKRCLSEYDAMAESIDFQGRDTIFRMDKWFEDNTHEKIKHVVDRLEPGNVLFLVNALYFKGDWKDKFDKGNTKQGPFHLLSGKTAKAPMMSQSGNFGHLAGKGFQAVELPYGSGRFEMCIFLPDANSSLAEFLKTLNGGNWDGWMKGFTTGEGSVTMPRFRTEYEAVLNKTLQALGMKLALDPKAADFSAMGTGQVWLGLVKQKTFIYVDEQGTEAAAGTTATMATADKGPSFEFIADRPFFYAIRDTQTGAVLFCGALMEPE